MLSHAETCLNPRWGSNPETLAHKVRAVTGDSNYRSKLSLKFTGKVPVRPKHEILIYQN